MNNCETCLEEFLNVELPYGEWIFCLPIGVWNRIDIANFIILKCNSSCQDYQYVYSSILSLAHLLLVIWFVFVYVEIIHCLFLSPTMCMYVNLFSSTLTANSFEKKKKERKKKNHIYVCVYSNKTLKNTLAKHLRGFFFFSQKAFPTFNGI